MAELSPAARAVLDAMALTPTALPSLYALTAKGFAVAALRALADHQQAPITLGQPIDHWSPDDHTRRELHNLAAELEGNMSTSSTHRSNGYPTNQEFTSTQRHDLGASQ